MKIQSIKAALPSRRISNDDIIGMIEEHSRDAFEGDLSATLHKVRHYLSYSGLRQRRWLGENETPIELLSRSIEEALCDSNVDRRDIDLLIYTGIGRGFLEPAGAYHVASVLGMDRVECFDLIDACMSWTRALHLLSCLFKAGAYKCGLVVNAEFNIRTGGPINPSLFKLRNPSAVEWSFPAYTLGEAATAAIFTADSKRECEFYFSSRPDLADLCNVPLEGYEGYCQASERIARNGVGKFTSFGLELHAKGNPEALAVFKRLRVPRREIRAVFTHASSKREWDGMADAIGIRDLVWHTYPYSGNLVSASVPAGIASAIERGRIQRGDRIAGWVGSAGMSFGAFSLVY